MYKLILSELAHQDLDDIVFHIAVKLANPTAAKNFIDELDKCYSYLKDNPMMYEKCRDERLEEEGYRKAVIKNYTLVYKINEDAKTVNVVRFFYGARDYVKLI